ncbi:MAG TPA: FmdB family zinc ribbon protein [Pyrinomonadaceae bacterium]|nr:FmdB family zinc ribbon protein [Pyrinomonadaceae bacterium]
MPIYEYKCQKCGAHLEVMQKMSDAPLKRHGKCGGKLEKQWSSTGFQFKGSGWYVTDYAGRKSEAKEDGAEKKSAEPADKKSEPAAADAASKGSDVKKEAGSKKSSAPKASGGASSGD